MRIEPEDAVAIIEGAQAVADEADKVVKRLMAQAQEHALKATELFTAAHALSRAVGAQRERLAKLTSEQPPAPPPDRGLSRL
jgi:hypothetical protein